MEWKSNVGKIKEIYDGQYHVLLDYATTAFLPYLIRDDFKFVWVSEHQIEKFLTWESYSLPLFEANKNHKILARQLNFDFILPTEEFKQLMPQIHGGITLTQLNVIPNYYLNSKLKDRTRYDLLKRECDYLFEVVIPSPTDYGSLTSPNKDFLEQLLRNEDIDWGNLP